MRRTTALPLIFFFLLFANLGFFASATPEAPEPVLDIADKILRADTMYYVLPAVPGFGGGLELASPDYHDCPLGVFQQLNKFQPSYPLLFTPVNPKKGVIRLSTDLNIKFAGAPRKCPQSTVWKVDGYDKYSRRFFIGVGGIEGQPGANTVNNWFKIEKLGHKDYKLVYCPSVCPHCKVICKDVGIFVQNGKNRLVLSDVPLKVVFKKA